MEGDPKYMTNEEIIHMFYRRIPHFMCGQHYKEYIVSYAQDGLYFVFDMWYHGIYFVKARSPKEAINNVTWDRLKYLPKEE